MPAISQRLLSRERLLARRTRAEQKRRAEDRPHEVHCFHQVDDPYSALLAQVLPALLSRYDISLRPHLVSPPADSAAPERAKLVAYSRRDAELLARHHGLEFTDPGQQPAPSQVLPVSMRLLDAIDQHEFGIQAGRLSRELWLPAAGTPMADATTEQLQRLKAHLAESDALRRRLGHYLGATLYYEGEWYWGVDRLHHLEHRLQELGARKPTAPTTLCVQPSVDLNEARPAPAGRQIDFYFSLRSPYSAIVAPRVFQLAKLTGAAVRLCYVLPMVMRGLPVPREKRRYISQDAAREAFVRGIPFGRLNDPVGRPTERGLSLMPLAEREGLGERYVLSFMQGVWAEGIDAGSDRGLRRIAERAGLTWSAAQAALKDEGWRVHAERHRAEMSALGLWGVPSFRVNDLSVWGQDRLWAVQDALLKP